MPADRNVAILYLLLGSAVAVTAYLHAVILPDYFPHDFLSTVPILVVAWVAFTVVFYTMGRLFSAPGSIPNMRGGDIGTTLVLFSLLVAVGFDSLGFTPERVLEAYLFPAIGVYVGLALLGWSLGKRTKAINRIAAESE